MKPHPKSATAENNLQNTKEVNRHTRQSEALIKGFCVANVKPHRGVCVGLSMTFSNTIW